MTVEYSAVYNVLHSSYCVYCIFTL